VHAEAVLRPVSQRRLKQTVPHKRGREGHLRGGGGL
jgi:hypothetical protein